MANETKQKAPRRYEKMRDSGVEWIGMVPEEWNILPAKKMFSEVKEKNSQNEYSNPFSFRYGEIVDKKLTGKTDAQLTETLSAYQVVMPNDIVLNGLNLNYDFVTQRVAIVQRKGVITSAYLVVRPDTNKIGPRYAMYLLKAFDFRQVFHGIGSGIRKTLKFQDFKELPILCPSEATQNAIAKYLDEKSKFIDEIIVEAKASIEEYKAWKSSIIYEAVTKGLNPTAEMKDSGVEWIGEIASSVSVIRLKYLIHDYKAGPFGSSLITGKLNNTGDILVYTPEHIAKQSVETKHNLYLPPSRLSEMSQFLVGTGDIIFPIVGSLGRAMVITEDMPEGIINQRLAKFSLRKNTIDTNYFMWLFGRSDFYSQYIESQCRGSIIVNLTKSIISDMPVVLPSSLQTQRQISDYLDKKCQLIDSLICEKMTLVSDLESYKKSLIYEVVTGKRKVV